MKRFFLLLPLLMLGACSHTTDPILTVLAGESVGTVAPTQFSWSGNGADATVQETVVARTEDEWLQLWLKAEQPAPSMLPPNKMAVGVFLGERQGLGYSVEIVSADRSQKLGQIDQLNIVYTEHIPSPKAQAATAANPNPQVTSPWAIRLVDTWPYAPIFTRQSQVDYK